MHFLFEKCLILLKHQMTKYTTADLQTFFIKEVLDTLISNLTTNNIEIPKNQTKNDEKYKIFFINAICKSCIGDMETLYLSFLELLNVDNIMRNQNDYIEIQDEIRLLQKKYVKSKKEKDQKLEEKDDKLNLCDTIKNYLDKVDEEYGELIKDPQFKEINQLETKTKKKSDKAERVNQMIIHDLIYLIDKLNRQITMKTQTKV